MLPSATAAVHVFVAAVATMVFAVAALCAIAVNVICFDKNALAPAFILVAVVKATDAIVAFPASNPNNFKPATNAGAAAPIAVRAAPSVAAPPTKPINPPNTVWIGSGS